MIPNLTFFDVNLFVEKLEDSYQALPLDADILWDRGYFKDKFNMVCGRAESKLPSDMLTVFLEFLARTNNGSFSGGGEDNPLYIDDLGYLIEVLIDSKLEEMPKYINSCDVYEKAISLWRLEIGK